MKPRNRFGVGVFLLLAAISPAQIGQPPHSGSRSSTTQLGSGPPRMAFRHGQLNRREDAGSVQIFVDIDYAVASNVFVNFHVTGFSPQDYVVNTASPVLIPVGQTSAVINVTLFDDELFEAPEYVIFNLDPTAGVIEGIPSRCILKIASDEQVTQDGTEPQPAFELDVAPTAVEFGVLRMGANPLQQTVVVQNNTGLAQTLSAASLRGRHDDDFDLATSQALPAVLAPGQSVDVDVDFQPNEKGVRRAVLVLQQPGGVKRTIQLRGLGLGPTGAEVLANAGGNEYLSGRGETWSPDYGFTKPSSKVTTTGLISNTEEPELYRSAREGAQFEYRFAVPNGAYDATLHFAEIVRNSPGERVFDVTVEGELIADNLDLYALIGHDAAYIRTVRVDVQDGELTIQFAASVGMALVNAIEVRSVPLITPDMPTVDFGTIPQDSSLELELTLSNLGLHGAHFDLLRFDVQNGDGSYFSLDLQGQIYAGDALDVSHPINVTLGGGASLDIPITFFPTEHSQNEVTLILEGDSPAISIPLTGNAGFGSNPYLHPVLLVDNVVVDYDGDGDGSTRLDGTGSHTHQPSHGLVAWEWTENSSVVSSLEDATVPFSLGQHTVHLEITDDNEPPESASDSLTFDVVPVDEVPGVLVRYYLGNPASGLLDNVPANANYAEKLPSFRVEADDGVSGTGFMGNVMVRLLGQFTVNSVRTWEFDVTGGSGDRIYLNGVLVTAPVVIGVGDHELEVRVAVDDMTDLPIDLRFKLNRGFQHFQAGQLTHDQTATPPVINGMPTEGTTLGGNQIVITGFGFFPEDDVIIHWGADDLTLADLTFWSAERIEFFSPPGNAGTINVSISTPHGSSGARSFEYRVDGPVPVTFTAGAAPTVFQPIAGEWGPDGRFYVISREGTLHALTFDDNFNVTNQVAYTGVSLLPNHDAMGLAFNPYDGTSPVKVYVSHSEMYAQGGGSFTGPSPYTGQISLLTGPNFNSPVPIVTQLPTSNHDHGVNAMVFDNRGDLLVLVGGNTNAGVPHAQIGDLPESPLSGAILKVELTQQNFNGALSYVETATGLANNDQVFGEEVDLAPGKHVFLQASGLRNSFDLCLSTRGLLYATDNGPNSGFGVASTGPTTDSGVHPYQQDELLLVEFDHYYGHPNRSRGRYVPIENVYFDPSVPEQPGFTQSLTTLSSSTNGLLEYRAKTFSDQIRGNLFAQRMSTATSRIVLSSDGRSVVSVNSVSPAPRGLGLTEGPGGALIAMDYFSHRVRVYLPNDASASGVTPFDITPWRAPASGGTSFVIGGLGFGTLANTSVTIGGIPATITSVSSKRIRGTLPNRAASMQPVDVSITTAGATRVISGGFLPMYPVRQQPGVWTSAASMPQPVGEIAAGVINGKMYVVGEGSTKTFRYNFLNNTWVDNMAIRQFTGHHHASEVYAGKWYLIGGLGQGAGTVQIYDPVANSWSLGATMPWNGGSVCTALIDGKIYASGGIVGTTTVDNCAAYDISANSWTNLANAPFQLGRNHAAAATDGDRLFIFGGRGIGSGAGNVVANGFPDVFVYNPATNTWASSRDVGSPLVPMPIGRGGMGKAVFYRNEFYVMGGETLNGPGAQPGNVYNRVDVYNPLNNSWRLDASMPTARHGIFPVVYQGKIYVAAGGTNAGFSQSSVFEVFHRQ